MPPAARTNDLTSHGPPLNPGPGSPDVLIGFLPAWRAIPAGMGAGIESASDTMNNLMTSPSLDPATTPAKLSQVFAALSQDTGTAASKGAPGAPAATASSQATLMTANVALTATYTAAAAVPGGEPAARTAYTLAVQAAAAAAMSAAMSAMAGMADMHICPIPVPIPPHGPGFVTKGSKSVFINKLPASRQGDKVVEAAGGSDPIAMGCQTVLIGDGGGGGAAAGAGASAAESGPEGGAATAAVAPGAAGAGAGAGAGTATGTPLTKSVTDEIAKCPAMKADLEKLQKDGWKVIWGPAGGGYHSSRPTKTITLDPSTGSTDQKTITMLSHEMGHAKYTSPGVTPAGLTREEYIKKQVQANLEDEGEATLTQIEYKKCLKKGGGPEVELWYAKSADYVKIADKYPDAKDRRTARTEVANMYGDSEKPSNCPAQTYRQYYEKPCCAPACGTGVRGWAESLNDDQWKALGGKVK